MKGTRSSTSARLWDRAVTLPLACASDFTTGRYPSGHDERNYRVIDDSALRARLILAGLAEGLQSPKGRQKIKSIVRLYPGDAPRGGPKGQRNGVTVLPSAALPTVEELEALLRHIGEASTKWR